MNDDQVYLFRPGEERRLLARMQFGLHRDGKCGAIFTYPIPGHPWRHNVVKTDSWQVDTDLAERIFQEVQRLPDECPQSCIPHKMLWADHTEKANAITRDRDTDTFCFTIGIVGAGGDFIVQYAAWQEYVAGTVPTNRESVFRALISVSNGVAWVTWMPDLVTARAYTVQGRTNMTEGAWGNTNVGIRFFRVNVWMP